MLTRDGPAPSGEHLCWGLLVIFSLHLYHLCALLRDVLHVSVSIYRFFQCIHSNAYMPMTLFVTGGSLIITLIETWINQSIEWVEVCSRQGSVAAPNWERLGRTGGKEMKAWFLWSRQGPLEAMFPAMWWGQECFQ